ncbi:hypothetical protein [Leptothoe kymatousa]|nr:hypothetical protein [Leptothoe kymatousa]
MLDGLGVLVGGKTSRLGSRRVPQTPWLGRSAALEPGGRQRLS